MILHNSIRVAQNLLRRNSHAQTKLGDMPSLNNYVRLTSGHRNPLNQIDYNEPLELAGNKHEQCSGWLEHQHCLGSAIIFKGCIKGNQQCAVEVPTNNGESCEDNQPSLRGSVHSITGSNPVHPFGSMPRLFNSALPNSFSQLARLTPSCLASLSNCSFNSGGMRIWNAGALPVPLGCLSRLMIVDMCVPIAVVFFQIGTHLITMLSIKTTPPNGITSTERGLTTTVSESNEAAMKDHITHPQGRKSYIWRFLALSAIGRNVIHITATTEREAREQSPAGCVMVFAGRLPVEVRHA